FHYKILLTSSLIYCFTAMNVMLIAALVGPIAREWGLDVVTMGYLMSSGYLGMFIGALLFGRLADVIGRRRVLITVLVLESVFTAACGLAWDLLSLYALRFLAGIGLGGALPQPGVYVSEYVPKKKRGLFLGLVETSWVYGVIISLLIPYLLLPSLGWRATFSIALLPLLTLPLAVAYLPESMRFLIVKGRADEVRKLMAKLGVKDLPEFRGLTEVKRYTVRDLVSRKYVRRTVLLFILWGGLIYTYHGIFLWLPTIYSRQFGLGDITSLRWTLLVTLFQIPGYYSASFLLDRVGRKRVLSIYLMAAGIFSALLSLKVDLLWIFAFSSLISFFNLGAWAGLYAYTPELYPTEIRGIGSGASASFGRLIGILAPSITGYLFSTTGISGPFAIFSFVHLLAGLAVILMGIETMGRSLEEI
ncbi:MAG: MFS transporter, partial [Candidatus Korarchaeum sp.]|nr:MFS transporter [Candidatus Korarchaeum sp.]